MSARARAGLFFALAGLAAFTGAAIVGSYRESALEGYGEMRPVLIAAEPLPGGGPLDARAIDRRVEVREVPERFLPSDGLSSPTEALGLEPATALPAGTYLTRSNLLAPRPKRQRRDPRLEGGRSPVEIAIDGAPALTTAGMTGPGRPRRVDVVVTSEPSGSGPGRTFVAAADVPLLALRGETATGGPTRSSAVLALDRRQALELIRAESFARSIRLLPISRPR